MLSPSLAMVVVVVAGGLVALVALGWAVARGWVSDAAIRIQSTSIFEPEDLTAERPWESDMQREERAALHGPPTKSSPGAFGGGR